MFVKELLHRQKYWTPITICGGGRSPDTFFCKLYGRTKEERWRAIEDYGDRMVRYFYYSTDYDSQPWKRLRNLRGIILKLFFWVNPQRLHIELYDEPPSWCPLRGKQHE